MTIDKQALATLMERREREALARADDHPNPAISVWRMIAGKYYGAVYERGRSRMIGYEIRNTGESPKFMPLAVARRLLRDGKCHRPMGEGWITADPDYGSPS